MAATPEIRKDIEELQKLEKEASRSRVKDLLNLEIRRLQTELQKREQKEAAEKSSDKPVKSAASTRTQLYNELIKTYAWDQSEKFMKLYVTLKGVQDLDKDAVSSTFADQSVKLNVKGLNGRNCELEILRLAEAIDTEGSYHKVKSDMVLLMMKKKQPGKTWASVTAHEKQAKEAKKPPPVGDNADPNAGMMSMLQNMYEEGDDEMKRTLKKAMFESQNKGGGMPNLAGMGGMPGMGGMGGGGMPGMPGMGGMGGMPGMGGMGGMPGMPGMGGMGGMPGMPGMGGMGGMPGMPGMGGMGGMPGMGDNP